MVPPLPPARTCVACGAPAPDPTSAYCEQCGRRLPPAGPRPAPRHVSTALLPEGGPAAELLADDLTGAAKTRAGALLVVGVLGALGALILFGMAAAAPRGADAEAVNALRQQAAVVGVLAALYIGLWGWSRKAPLPPLIVGTLLFSTFVLVELVGCAQAMNDRALTEEQRSQVVAGQFVPFIIRVAILAYLINGLTAALERRKLDRRLAPRAAEAA